MIKRSDASADRTVQVTFTLDAKAHPDGDVSVVGDFNDWDLTATPLKSRRGKLTATVALQPGWYRFRYRRADGSWFDDEAPDCYEANEYGGKNCVLDLTYDTTSS